MAKLMKPLFIGGMYNKEGKRIRVNYLKTISHNNIEYPLWINDGKPDNDYPRNEKDKYYLYVEINDWLIMTGVTEFNLEQRAGQEILNKEWYGDFQGREKYFNENFYNNRSMEEAHKLVRNHIDKEELFIEENGKREDVQVMFLKNGFDKSIKNYIETRDNNGKFADFIGALLINELDKCYEISTVLKQEREKERQEKDKLKAIQEEQKRKEEEEAENLLIKETENIFINGGTVKGGDIIVKLADKYNVNIPIRTRGWILNTLSESIITESGGVSYRYWKRKKATGSQKVFDVLSEIRMAIKNERLELI